METASLTISGIALAFSVMKSGDSPKNVTPEPNVTQHSDIRNQKLIVIAAPR